MKTLEVGLVPNAYPIYLGEGLLQDAELWRPHLGPGKILVVSNEIVAPLYLEQLRAALPADRVEVHVLPDGEQYKTQQTWYGILDRLVAMKARRDACVIALGGGVVGDITGFAGASYMRGIRLLQAPTTLLAQVDSSVGGKTGINHERGKNLVGAFHQPHAVFIDSSTLHTLPEREYSAGLAEVVKYGAIRDPELLDWMARQSAAINRRERDAVEHLVQRSVEHKAEIVAEDEKEAGVRALLNFGHTFGHALEAETDYKGFLHGEAVAIGMVTAAILSEQRGMAPNGSAQQLAGLLEAFDLPVRIPAKLDCNHLAATMQLDKKAVASGLRLILLDRLGRAVIDSDSAPQQILTAMKANQDS